VTAQQFCAGSVWTLPRLFDTCSPSEGGIFLRRCIQTPFQPVTSRSHVQVLVRENNVDQALRALKKKMQREGIFREMKLRGHYEKPSEKKAREKAEAVRRARKLVRKRLQREGLLPPSKPRVVAGAKPPRV
jgi:small subunit ribosomal protein S21